MEVVLVVVVVVLVIITLLLGVVTLEVVVTELEVGGELVVIVPSGNELKLEVGVNEPERPEGKIGVVVWRGGVGVPVLVVLMVVVVVLPVGVSTV